jgi:hypothetical protein
MEKANKIGLTKAFKLSSSLTTVGVIIMVVRAVRAVWVVLGLC